MNRQQQAFERDFRYISDSMTTIAKLFLVCILACIFAVGQSLRPLSVYSQCNVKGFNVEHVDYLQQPVERSIETKDGSQTVVMVEGARILISFQDRPFLNLKAERFAQGAFAKDKQTQLDGLRHMAEGTEGMDVSGLQPTKVGNLQIYHIDRRKMEGGVLSVVLAVDEPNRVMMTGYFLNDEPEARAFKTLEEFRSLRDQYLKSLGACLAK